MSDARTREQGRRWAATGDAEAQEAWLRGRLRAGQLRTQDLPLLAMLDHPFARELVGPLPRVVPDALLMYTSTETSRAWVKAAQAAGKPRTLSAVTAACRVAMVSAPEEAVFPLRSAIELVLEGIDGWCLHPGPEWRLAVVQAQEALERRRGGAWEVVRPTWLLARAVQEERGFAGHSGWSLGRSLALARGSEEAVLAAARDQAAAAGGRSPLKATERGLTDPFVPLRLGAAARQGPGTPGIMPDRVPLGGRGHSMPRHTSVTFTAGAGARRFELTEGRQLIIGRSTGADLQVNSPRLSRKHAAVKLEQRGLTVEDLGSANGTFVNGQRVQQALLRPGDIVMVGGVAIRVDFDQALVPDLDLRCERCARLVSMARCEEGQVFEMGRQFLCQECATILRHQDLTQAEQELVAILAEEGYRVAGKSPLSTGLVPVFEAYRPGIERPYAIKALPLVSGISPKKVARFQTEARSAAKVRHANVIEIYDIHQHPRALYIVMEHVKGDLILEVLEKRGPLDHQAGLRVGLLVARALKQAHEMGIVHRDLKPGGIILTPDGQPKVADFGLAKDLWSLTGHMTGPEETLGTVRYMPPEQVKNAREADHRADYYSLGATMFHILTGQPPYTAVHELELMGRVLNGTLPPFDPTRAGLPRPITTLLGRLMGRDPRERPQTGDEVLSAFSEAIAELAGIKGYRGDPELLLSMPAQNQMESTWQNMPAPPKQGGVSAVFEKEELSEYLQLLLTTGRTGLLSIVSQELSGHMAVERGRLRAAITNRRQRDREAAIALLTLKSGQFQFVPSLPTGFEPEIDLDLRAVLIDAARIREGASRRLQRPM